MEHRYTREVAKQALELYKTETLAQLRKRQRLCREQRETAFKARNTEALVDLDVMDTTITEAIMWVEFEKPKKTRKAKV
jgi:hypothetical protein